MSNDKKKLLRNGTVLMTVTLTIVITYLYRSQPTPKAALVPGLLVQPVKKCRSQQVLVDKTKTKKGKISNGTASRGISCHLATFDTKTKFYPQIRQVPKKQYSIKVE